MLYYFRISINKQATDQIKYSHRSTNAVCSREKSGMQVVVSPLKTMLNLWCSASVSICRNDLLSSGQTNRQLHGDCPFILWWSITPTLSVAPLCHSFSHTRNTYPVFPGSTFVSLSSPQLPFPNIFWCIPQSNSSFASTPLKCVVAPALLDPAV